MYPNLADPEAGYLKVMVTELPPSLRGLMLAGFAAAFMSTIGTMLNLHTGLPSSRLLMPG